jgi:hypothetical protein
LAFSRAAHSPLLVFAVSAGALAALFSAAASSARTGPIRSKQIIPNTIISDACGNACPLLPAVVSQNRMRTKLALNWLTKRVLCFIVFTFWCIV